MNKYIKIILIISLILLFLCFYISNFLVELAQDIDKEAHKTKIKLIDYGKYSDVTTVQYSPRVIAEAEETCSKILHYSNVPLDIGHYILIFLSESSIAYLFHLALNKLNLYMTKRADNK